MNWVIDGPNGFAACNHCNWTLSFKHPSQGKAAVGLAEDHLVWHAVAALEGWDVGLAQMCQNEAEELVYPPDFLGLSECEALALVQGAYERVCRAFMVPYDSDETIEEGIARVLGEDLPRAKALWYPVNPDGTFNC
ncbi:MAG: hypothetical protein Q8Q00_08775 [Dehalococcoidia bacterium]|nr:hypothetical protein [Dehalococcoidia bacterium]